MIVKVVFCFRSCYCCFGVQYFFSNNKVSLSEIEGYVVFDNCSFTFRQNSPLQLSESKFVKNKALEKHESMARKKIDKAGRGEVFFVLVYSSMTSFFLEIPEGR